MGPCRRCSGTCCTAVVTGPRRRPDGGHHLGGDRRLQRGAGVEEVTVAYLIGIARHKLVDHWRQEERWRRHVSTTPSLPGAVCDEYFEPGRVEEAMKALSPMQRAALTLRYVDDLPVSTVASILGRSVAATETLLMRANAPFAPTTPGANHERSVHLVEEHRRSGRARPGLPAKLLATVRRHLADDSVIIEGGTEVSLLPDPTAPDVAASSDVLLDQQGRPHAHVREGSDVELRALRARRAVLVGVAAAAVIAVAAIAVWRFVDDGSRTVDQRVVTGEAEPPATDAEELAKGFVEAWAPAMPIGRSPF